MKELMYYLSQNPELVYKLEKNELSLVIDPKWGVSNETIVNVLKNLLLLCVVSIGNNIFNRLGFPNRFLK